MCVCFAVATFMPTALSTLVMSIGALIRAPALALGVRWLFAVDDPVDVRNETGNYRDPLHCRDEEEEVQQPT